MDFQKNGIIFATIHIESAMSCYNIYESVRGRRDLDVFRRNLEIGGIFMNKILYTALTVMVTVWSIFFITRNPSEQLAPETIIISQEQAQIAAIRTISPAVVGVANIQNGRVIGEGSGVVYQVNNGNTYIVTNEHVIDGAHSLEVVFNNGSQQPAEVVGADAFTDLAVLRLEGYEAATIAPFGSTEDLEIGQSVIAIGNPLGLTFAGSATMGIVSGHDRTVPVTINHDGHNRRWEMTVMQTDAAINPGNSGGALINLSGEVIGIPSMKVSAQDVYGMSFSIPTYVVQPVIADIEAYGRVIRPTLGVMIQPVDSFPIAERYEYQIPAEQANGVRVNQVVPGTMAETMGIQAGDIITYIGDQPVNNVMAFTQELFTYREGDSLTLTLIRNGVEMQLDTVIVILN